jgi:hypothetical protein
MPEVRLVPQHHLGAAAAAFGSNIIFMSDAFRGAGSSDPVAWTPVDFMRAYLYLEEVGHAIEQIIKSSDTRGDEGTVFAFAVTGTELSNDAWATDAQGEITIDGMSYAGDC